MSVAKPALIVPIDLAALVVSDADTESAIEFGDVAASFENLPYSASPLSGMPNLAQTALPQPFDQAGVPGRGVHLHWALPDALTHGSTDGSAGVDFPVTPDRWLVARVAGAAGSTPKVTAWIIESDHLWDQGDLTDSGAFSNDALLENVNSRAIPLDPPLSRSDAKTFCAMGRVFEADKWTGDRGTRSVLMLACDAGGTELVVDDITGWMLDGNTVAMIHDGDSTETVAVQSASTASGRPTLTLQAPLAFAHGAGIAIDTYAGDRHTALGYGTPSFAAAYPHCPNVFGFHDRLDGVAATNLFYVVAGWYSSALHDPLQGIKLPDPVKGRVTITDRGWSFDAGTAPPDHTICSALLRGIDWSPSKSFLQPRKARQVAIAIGNTTAEAVAALLATRDAKTIPDDLRPDFERLIEYFQLGLLTQLGEPDGAATADEARHQSHFGSESAGTTWVIQPTTDKAPRVPNAASVQLDQLNEQQQRCDGIAFEIESRRRQIFADWYKYMSVAYPGQSSPPVSIDDACNFVDQGAVPALNAATTRLGPEVAKLFECKRNLEASLVGGNFRLLPTGAPRYWRPNEPVLLLSGDDVRPSSRYSTTSDTLGCRLSTIDVPGDVDGFVAEVTRLDAGNNWAPPWIPLFLEWEAELTPQQPAGASHDDGQPDLSYTTDFIETNYSLGRDRLDLALVVDPADGTSRQPSVYQGSTILAARTEMHLAAQMTKYAAEHPDDAEAKELAAMADALDLVAMAQSMTGFNEALLMRQQTLQLPVADPMEIDQNRWTFNMHTVRDAVGDGNSLAPMPNYAFNPIRAGRLTLTRLRVVDAFGQVLRLIDRQATPPLDPPVIVPHGMKIAGLADVVLPPRLSQPARLQFRWLPADAASTSPLCGWILFNHIDDSLMVYDAAGNALGSLNVQGPFWQGAPGNADTFGRAAKDAIANPHLKKFVLGVRDAAMLTAMLNAIDKSMTSINPLGYKQDQGIGLLIGQPLAIVRASLRLELQGLPAIDESWKAYAQAVGDPGQGNYTIDGRFNAGSTSVRFPVRLGDLGSHDDGLIGYYIDDGSDAAYATLYCPAALLGSKGVVMPTDRTLMLAPVASSDQSPPTLVTMLIDPRGCVHATTGILPVKDISIPPAAYSGALQKMAVTFLTSPVLSGESVALPLPDEPGYTWKWIANSGKGGWPDPKDIAPPAEKAAFAAPKSIEEGWLKLIKDPSP